MARLEVDGDHVVVRLNLVERLAALRWRPRCPVASVVSVKVLPSTPAGLVDSIATSGPDPGLLAGIHGIDVDHAFTLLRSYARNHNRRLVDLAHTVISDASAVPDLTTARDPAPAEGRPHSAAVYTSAGAAACAADPAPGSDSASGARRVGGSGAKNWQVPGCACGNVHVRPLGRWT